MNLRNLNSIKQQGLPAWKIHDTKPQHSLYCISHQPTSLEPCWRLLRPLGWAKPMGSLTTGATVMVIRLTDRHQAYWEEQHTNSSPQPIHLCQNLLNCEYPVNRAWLARALGVVWDLEAWLDPAPPMHPWQQLSSTVIRSGNHHGVCTGYERASDDLWEEGDAAAPL